MHIVLKKYKKRDKAWREGESLFPTCFLQRLILLFWGYLPEYILCVDKQLYNLVNMQEKIKIDVQIIDLTWKIL